MPFPQFELQARLVARVLSGRAALPSRSAMAAEMDKFYAGLREAGVPPKWTHMMDVRQWYAAACSPEGLLVFGLCGVPVIDLG